MLGPWVLAHVDRILIGKWKGMRRARLLATVGDLGWGAARGGISLKVQQWWRGNSEFLCPRCGDKSAKIANWHSPVLYLQLCQWSLWSLVSLFPVAKDRRRQTGEVSFPAARVTPHSQYGDVFRCCFCYFVFISIWDVHIRLIGNSKLSGRSPQPWVQNYGGFPFQVSRLLICLDSNLFSITVEYHFNGGGGVRSRWPKSTLTSRVTVPYCHYTTFRSVNPGTAGSKIVPSNSGGKIN